MSELKLLAESETGRHNAFIRWLPRIGVSGFFIFVAGLDKLTPTGSGWAKLFDQIGAGQWLRYVTGAMQVGGGILLLIPRTLLAGATVLACTMVGAIFVQIFVLHSPASVVFPALLLAAIAVVVWRG